MVKSKSSSYLATQTHLDFSKIIIPTIQLHVLSQILCISADNPIYIYATYHFLLFLPKDKHPLDFDFFFYNEIIQILPNVNTYASTAAKLLQSCQTLCDPMDSSPPGFSAHVILQERTLERIAMLFSKGSSQARNRTCVSDDSCTGRWVLQHQLHLGSLSTHTSAVFMLHNINVPLHLQ